MDSIKFPISFSSSGGLERLEDETDDYYKQILSISCLTEPDSLPLTPDFGVFDPTFNSVEKGTFILHASHFVPEVEIEGIDSFTDDEGQNLVSFSFRRR